MGCPVLPTPPPGWQPSWETGGKNRGPWAPGPGLRRRKRMLHRRGREGGAGPHGPPRHPAGPGGRTSRPLSSASGVAGGSAAFNCRPHAVARFHARTSSGARAAPLALPALGLGAPDLPAPRGRPPPVSREEAREGGGGGEGGGRHVTLLATFHHSHQINNFSIPRPHPASAASQCAPKIPPICNPQTSFSKRDEGELDPITKSQRPKGAAGSKGEGVVNFLRMAQRSRVLRGGSRGRRRGGPRAGSPQLFTPAARRGEPQRGAGEEEAAAVVSSPLRGQDPEPRF